jgi:hypothetical protein
MELKEAIRTLTTAKLKRAIELKERIEKFESELAGILTAAAPKPIGAAIRTRRKMSAAARAAIAEKARQRWAKWRAAKGK